MTGRVATFAAALLPPTWPARDAVLEQAEQVDRELGAEALDELLAAWADWRQSGALPLCRSLAVLLPLLHDVVTGGLGPRPMPHARSIA